MSDCVYFCFQLLFESWITYKDISVHKPVAFLSRENLFDYLHVHFWSPPKILILLVVHNYISGYSFTRSRHHLPRHGYVPWTFGAFCSKEGAPSILFHKHAYRFQPWGNSDYSLYTLFLFLILLKFIYSWNYYV